MPQTNIVLVSLYHNFNFALRILHPLLKRVEGVRPHTIFFKNVAYSSTAMPTAKEEEFFLRIIANLKPALVGFSVITPFVPAAEKLTRIVKENSDSLVIWGGVHPTVCPDSSITHADMICRGEGEGAMLELAQALKEGANFTGIKNLWVKDNGQVIKNPLRPLIQDLDSLPYPAYAQPDYYFVNDNKLSRIDPLPHKTYYVQASRGCPYSCSYCVNSLLHPLYAGLGPHLRRRSVDNVIKEIKSNPAVWSDPNMRLVFMDEVFSTDPAWIDEFRVKYAQEVGKPFWMQCNPVDVTPEMVEKLASCGLQLVKFGIQTGSQRICNRIYNRPGEYGSILDLLNKVKPLVEIKYDFMVGNPYDTCATLIEYIEFLLKLPKPLDGFLFGLQFFPGYPLTQKALKDKYITLKDTQPGRLMVTLRTIGYRTRLFPLGRKKALENIIWLYYFNHASEKAVRLAIKEKSLIGALALIYLDLKSIIWGAILSDSGLLGKHIWLRENLSIAWGHLRKGEFGVFFNKLKKRLKIG